MCIASPYNVHWTQNYILMHMCTHPKILLATGDIVHKSTITHCDTPFAILNIYLFIKEGELAVVQVGGHYCFLNGFCRIIVTPVVSESKWGESKHIVGPLC